MRADVPRGIVLTFATRTVEEAQNIRDRVARYFGEAEWTDPEAFAYCLVLASRAPEMLEDEWLMRQITKGGDRW